MARPRFRTLPHGADLRLAVWGTGEEELIRNAVVAFSTVALGRPPAAPPDAWVEVRPWPASLSRRLVRAVNEALFQLYVKRRVAVTFELRGAAARLGLAAPASGCEPVLEIKAATYHDLRPRRHAGRLAALLTLDV